MLEKKRWQGILFVLLCCLEFVTIETFFDTVVTEYTPELMGKNLALILLANLILVSLWHRMRPAMLLSTVFVLVFGIANYFVYQFRGYGIVFMDFYAVKTAATVAGHYSYQIEPHFVAGCAVGLASVALCLLFPAKKKPYLYGKTTLASVIGLLAGAVFIFWINTDATFFRDVNALTWDHNIGIHDYGYVLYFTGNAGVAKVEAPEGYSPEKAEEILSRYEVDEKEGQVTSPNLILIMNEAFSDLRVLGHFRTNQPVMPFYDSLKENTIKGYAQSSVYGGYTANSEFEFLTGCSKAFLPGNPYLQYMDEEIPSLIQNIKSQGNYKDAVAMHPYNGSGYNRNRVYPLLCFDRFLTIEDFQNPLLVRDYISDREDYEKIQEIYQKKEKGSSLCLFNVTMQNHNPYNTQSWQPDNPVEVTSIRVSDSVNQYLSLMKMSDDALRELITYFRAQEEPTVILLFGDHQPHLPDDFYEKLSGKNPLQFSREDTLQKYKVPFMIWANYDIPEQTVECTSLNYLSSLLLQTAGMKMSDYNRYLLDLRKKLPVFSAVGYSDAEGKNYDLSNPGEKHKELIREYEIVQYNYLFDKEHRLNKHYTVR